MPFPELLSLSPRTRQRLAGWTCVLSYAWALAAPLAHAGLVLPLEGTGRYSHRNAQGQPQRVTYADGLFTETYYTPSGQPWKTKDETGLESRIHYNAAGMPIRSIVMSGTTAALHPTTITAYDLAGNANRVTVRLEAATTTTPERVSTTQQFHDAGRTGSGCNCLTNVSAAARAGHGTQHSHSGRRGFLSCHGSGEPAGGHFS